MIGFGLWYRQHDGKSQIWAWKGVDRFAYQPCFGLYQNKIERIVSISGFTTVQRKSATLDLIHWL